MSVVPGSIHARITLECVSAVLSGTGTRNVVPDSRSTPPNTHCPFAGCPLWYLRRPNLLTSISTVLLGPPIFSEQPSKYTSSVSVRNTPGRDRVITEVMFALDLFGRFAAQDVVREIQNLLEGEFTLLKPRAVPNGPRPMAPGSSYSSSTSPSKTIYNTRISVPGHIATARITRCERSIRTARWRRGSHRDQEYFRDEEWSGGVEGEGGIVGRS